MVRWAALFLAFWIATPGRAVCWLEPKDQDVAFVAELGFVGALADTELGSGLLGLGRLAASNVAPEAYAGGVKLWRELKLEAVARDALSGRLAVVLLGNGQWATAAEFDVERALALVDRLNAKARSIDASGPILTVGGGRYVAAVRPGRALDGSNAERLATIVLAPSSSEDLVKRLGRGLLGGAGVLGPGERVEVGEAGDASWMRVFMRLESGFASVEARGNAERWDVRARLPRGLVVGERVETLAGLDRETFDRVSEGAAVSVAGLADLDLTRRTPILGAVVDLLPPEQAEMISGRPSMLTARVVDVPGGQRRLSMLVLVHADAEAVDAEAVDGAVDHAAMGLGLSRTEMQAGFCGFRPEAARRRPIDGPTRELLEPLTGTAPVLEWARVREDGWWAVRLAAGESAMPGVREALAVREDAIAADERVLSFGLVSPSKIGASGRAEAVMPVVLADAFSKIGEIRWQTRLAGDDSIEIEIRVLARRER